MRGDVCYYHKNQQKVSSHLQLDNCLVFMFHVPVDYYGFHLMSK